MISAEPVRRYYQQEQWLERADPQPGKAPISINRGVRADGVRMEVAANIAHAVEAEAAFSNGAEAVGLFRTENAVYGSPDSTFRR
ncbi:Multiphosphoryl transfer protein 1 [Serratia fonticola]|uniref:Multiphosphoryl transfer protein 1 n=1 Tax=Serratia fonticola TaxID=47917 RepID=A0A4U9WMK4_SERFO|nr:Multiphosphoryl transfer protein 1 [Serratia fonticola]